MLIVVTGRPGSGKTTLAHRLAQAVRCPAICRDEFKEGFVNTTGNRGRPGDAVAWAIYEAFFEVIELMLRRQITLIAEAAFQHKLWMPKLTHVMQFSNVRIIHCTVDAQVARQRFIERGFADPKRTMFHDDRAVQAAMEGQDLPLGTYQPPRLDVPTLIVDTSDGYSFALDEMVNFIGR